jgi:hypothetical protein
MNIERDNFDAHPKRETVASLLSKAFADQTGQTLPFVALLMLSMLGVSGLVIDVGHAYVTRSQLQNSANAAALAAAGYVYTSQSASVNTTTEADQYSAGSGGKNAITGSTTVATSVTTKCLNMLMPKGMTCSSSSSSNAVQVVLSTSVKTMFMALFGVKNLNVSATATASMQGASQPWNVAIIVDSTGSMATTDSNCGGVSEFQCALSGVQALLENPSPCPAGVSSCSSSTANIRVSLFTFPPVLLTVSGAQPTVNGTSMNSINADTNCNGSPSSYGNWKNEPLAAPYILPIPGATLPVDATTGLTYMAYKQTSTNKTWNATYQITPFLNDYAAPSAASGLNSSSKLVQAVGYGSTLGCLTYTFGIDGSNGGGSHFGNTYFASAIYAAQSALVAAQGTYGGQNAIVFLSDGQANASYYTKNSSLYGGSDSSNQYVDATEFPEAPAGSEVGPSTTSYPVPAFLTPATSVSSTIGYSTLGVNGKGIYPDWYDQCQQAITAAQYSTNKGTTVFAVAYGSQQSGCISGWNVGITDSTLVATGANYAFGLSGLTPCVTMENVASSLNTFYSDYNQSGSGSTCQDSSHQTVSLQEIFQAIGSTFSTPRLIPNNAT